MFRFLPYLLSCSLLLSTALPASAGGVDCDDPGTWAERTVCRDTHLRAQDTQLQALYQDALLRSDDTAAFEAEHRQWADEKRNACNTERCLDTTYRTRMDEFRQRIASGRLPLLMPGTYRRHAGGAAVADAASLEVDLLGQRHYRLRVLTAAPDADPLWQGEFEEQVGSARFESGECTFGMSFAPDLVSLSGASAGCDAELDGSYLRAASEP